MICEIVSYPAPEGADREEIVDDAKSVVPKWKANPDLIRKHFLWSDDGEKCCGVYLWKSREAAERAHDATWRREVETRTGKAPEIFSGNAASGTLAFRRRADGGYTVALADLHEHLINGDSFRYLHRFLPGLRTAWKTTRARRW